MCFIEHDPGKGKRKKIKKPNSQRQFCCKAVCQKDGEKSFWKRGLSAVSQLQKEEGAIEIESVILGIRPQCRFTKKAHMSQGKGLFICSPTKT